MVLMLRENTNIPIGEDGPRMVFDRAAAHEYLIKRDGDRCMFPGCSHAFSDNAASPWHPTIDHIYPQGKARKAGWHWEQIWDTDNLQIMHRICNQRKGDTEYNEDGTLTLVEVVRSVKLARPDICSLCYAGRLLTRGEECPDCGSKPQPSTWPAYLQKDPRECGHDRESHCKFCVPGIGAVERIEPLAL